MRGGDANGNARGNGKIGGPVFPLGGQQRRRRRRCSVVDVIVVVGQDVEVQQPQIMLGHVFNVVIVDVDMVRGGDIVKMMLVVVVRLQRGR